MAISEEKIVDALKEVYDPEVPVNIYDLGLIYSIDIEQDSDINIKMTLTSKGCPAAQSLPEAVRKSVSTVANGGSVDVEVVWDPAWNPSMISDEGKQALGIEE